MKKFTVYYMDHSDNETSTEVTAKYSEVRPGGDLLFLDANGQIIYAFARGRWYRFDEQGRG